MTLQKKRLFTIALTSVTYLIMVTMNALANILPINGQNTGEISDAYPNLFAPAGITFSIWGLIYLLLFVYIIYQGAIYHKSSMARQRLLTQIGIIFSISSIANALWILAWHYEVFIVSLLLMFIILGCLIGINKILQKQVLSTKDRLFIRLPFAVYFGWITVATIANVTTFLVAINWQGFNLSEIFWTNLIILIGTVIGAAGILLYKTKAYGFTIIWAYIGILIKHTSADGFNSAYPSVVVSVSLSIALLCIVILYLKFSNKKMRRPY
jgi:MFS family permease